MSSESSPRPLSRWEKQSDRSLAATRILDLRAMEYRHPVRGTAREFVVIQAPSWVVTVALTPDGRLVCVEQFRFGVDGFSLELPGGVIDLGEDPVTAGQRELSEETGYVGARARLLGSTHPNPAIQSNQCHYVLVEDAVRSAELGWDADEEIAITARPVEEVLAAARTGGITHALAINALFLFEPVWRARASGPGV